ncbi:MULTISPECIES: PAS domain-containing protein [unclassified Flavobacterium]|nr:MULTISPECIES: PAS domain-containing protein [unclassified Flavobacterium]MQP52008.1 PAS domain-containing protein [Flavobacterium sp. LMO9]MQP61877.1 PAS domain-containing protein [Flavobacterium sp. LMO6]
MLEKYNFNDEIIQHFIIDQTELVAKTGSWELDLLTNDLYWSKGVFRILEREPETKKLNISMELEIIHPDDLELVIQKKKEAIENGTDYQIKKRFVTKNNTIKHIISSGKVIFDENKKPIKLIGVFQDVTEFIEIKEKIELLNKITNDVIYEWDILKDEFSWGEGFRKIFGYHTTSTSFKLKNWLELIHPKDIENQKEDWQHFINTPEEKEWVKKLRFKRQDNSYIYVEETAILIRNKEGIPVKMIGLLKDISVEKTLEIQKKLQDQVTFLFKSEKKTTIILNDLLHHLTQNDDFLRTEIWLIDSNKKNIVLKNWSDKNTTIEKFFIGSKDKVSFKKGIGLPGLVWKTKKDHIYTTKQINENYPNNFDCSKIDLNTIFSIPLFNKTNLIGSLIFFCKEDLNNYPCKINAYQTLSNLLGAEIERKLEEETHRLMFESAPDILTIVNSDGYFKKVNPAFCSLLGFTEEELKSKPFTYFLHPDDLKLSEIEYNEIISNKRKANNFVNRYRTKSGEYKWFSWSTSEIFGDENNSFAFGRNITEMKELQNLFLETARLAEIGSWEYDISVKKNSIYLSKVVKDILELETDITISLNFLLDFTHEDDRKKTKKAFHNLIHFGENFDIEFQIITHNNNNKWVRCIGKVQHNDLNKKQKILGSIQNITKQKINELKLAKKNTLLSSITNVTSELMQSNNWHESLYNSFQITGNTINVDRIYFFEMDINHKKDEITCSQKLEWTKNNIVPQIDNPELQNIPVNEFYEFYERLSDGKIIFGVTSKLPSGSFKTLMENQNIKSFLIYPVFINNNMSGFIGFDDCNTERIWSESEISFLSNITFNLTASLQRKTTNLELEKSLKEKNNILESVDDAFISLDKNWIVNYWNKKAEEIFSLNREKIIGKNLWEVFPNLTDSIYEENYKKAFETKKSINFQNFFEDLNIWLDVTAYPSKNGLSIYYKDITQTKKYEYDLKSSNDRFEKSTAATNDAIWDWDLNKNSLYRGEGFLKLFGYKVPNLIYNTNILDLIKSKMKPKKADKIINTFIKSINSPKKKSWKKEYWYKKANGEYAYIINNAIIIRDEKGTAIRIVGALQDITYRKEQENKLRDLNKKLETHTKSLIKSNQELEHFAYVASHDLQEPLRMVTSFLTQLEKKYTDKLDDKGKQYIDFAVDGAKRMRNIILDILEYSKLGKIEEINESIDINLVIEDVCKMNIQKIQETNAIINYTNLPTIISSKFPITQIFHNLVGNALKYQKINNKPIINITAIDDGKNWKFKISDNGIGIENEYLEKIFIIFQRLHTKQEYGGNGMGLAIVKKLIENLNGKIWVESELDKGTTFYIILPKNEDN